MKDKFLNLLTNFKFYNWLTKKPIWTLFLLFLVTNFLSSVLYNIDVIGVRFLLITKILANSIIMLTLINLAIFFIFFLLKKVGEILAYVFCFLSIILFLINAFLFSFYKTSINQTIIDAVFNTNKNETFEFIEFFFDYKILIFSILFCVFCFFITKINPPKSNQIKSNQIKSSYNFI